MPALAAAFHTGRYWARVGLGLAVITGIEAALWDLRGKELGEPVYQLLGGGKHDSLLGYATGGRDRLPEAAPGRQDRLLPRRSASGRSRSAPAPRPPTARSTRSPSRPPAADFEAREVRASCARHVGPDIKVLLDGHQDNLPIPGWEVPTAWPWSRPSSRSTCSSSRSRCRYTNPWGYGELRGATSVPIAGGETLTGVPEWRVFAEQDAFDIAQPDAAFCGGLGEFLRIAALFEARGRKIATHAWGAGGALMQNIHAAFAAPNTVICEIPPAFGPLHSEIVGDSFVMRDGRVLPPETPGLGITLSARSGSATRSCRAAANSTPVPGKPLTDVGYPGLERQAPSAPRPSPEDRP